MMTCQKCIPLAAEHLLLKGWKGYTPLVAIKTKQANLIESLLDYDAKNGALELVADEFITKPYLMMNKEII